MRFIVFMILECRGMNRMLKTSENKGLMADNMKEIRIGELKPG